MKRIRKILIVILIAAFLMNGFAESMITVNAGSVYNPSNTIIFTEKVGDIIGTPGETTHVKLPVRATADYIQDPRISVDITDMQFNVENIKLSAEGYTEENPPIGISNFSTTYIEFDLKVKETAKISNKKMKVQVEYVGFNRETNVQETFINDLPSVNFVILNEKEPAQLTIDSVSLNNATLGNTTELAFTIKNEGEISSLNTMFRVEGYEAAGLIPEYSKLKQEAGTEGRLPAGETYRVKLPVTVSGSATPGTKTLSIFTDYKDIDGAVYTTETKIYVNVTENSLTPAIEIESTKYAGELKAGSEFVLITTIRNEGVTDAESIEVSVEGLGINSFIPNYSTDTISGGTLEHNAKRDVRIPLIVPKEATSGLKEITVKINYMDDTKVVYTKTSKLYLEVMATDDAVASKPKLIISNFTTDVEELRAGNTFNFIFDIYNTHTSLNAKNIKVTVSQADNIFAVTNGSNTFYIDQIAAGQKQENSIELKVKADATTKAYPIEIKIEYEYDGAEANPATGEIGETVTETINLQAVENARPVVENVYVGNWDVPVVNQPTALTFEFYNMGKSTLNNVYATVQGDYLLSTGSMYFIGNVEAGYSEYAELEVIPSLEGLAKGTLVITFEDSNGDEINITKEFEATVQGEFIPDGGEMPGEYFPVEEPVKEPIIPTWLFVLLQIVILVVGIPATRKIILKLHKRKLRKIEDANLGD
ncbi:MAG: hypothetical protein K0R21_634 [Anaerocolumna sp.]|nr:hypothetical protein [Anaerocolumna sp.]